MEVWNSVVYLGAQCIIKITLLSSHMGDRLLDIQVGVLSIKSVLYMGKD